MPDLEEDRLDKVAKYLARHRVHFGAAATFFLGLWFILDLYKNNGNSGKLILALSNLSVGTFTAGAFKSDEFHKQND